MRSAIEEIKREEEPRKREYLERRNTNAAQIPRTYQQRRIERVRVLKKKTKKTWHKIDKWKQHNFQQPG